MKEFNAKVGLKGFDATVSHAKYTQKNVLEVGKELIFKDTGKMADWGKDKWPVVETEDGVICNAPYIAACMLDAEGVILNKDQDRKFHCMHTPRTSKLNNLELDYVQNHITEEGTFPKMVAVDTLPVAVLRTELITKAREETKAIYQQMLGVPLEKLTMEYLPSYKKSDYTTNGGVFSVRSSVVTLA